MFHNYFPVPFYITQLVLLQTRSDLDNVYTSMTNVNGYVCIICAVFATGMSFAVFDFLR
jgi:NAD/NADP transhydrogenase alpha subunit